MPEQAITRSDRPVGVSLSPEELLCIKTILHNIIPDREVLAFGSRITTSHKLYSDLDLAVMGDSLLAIEKIADLRSAFSESDLPFKVDVIVWSELTDNFKRIVQNHYVVIQSDLSQ